MILHTLGFGRVLPVPTPAVARQEQSRYAVRFNQVDAGGDSLGQEGLRATKDDGKVNDAKVIATKDILFQGH